jgi:V/A-type H+-transporting ATPase subunit I
MFRPRKMKMIELSALKSDMNSVLEYLGRRGVIQFPSSHKPGNSQETANIRKIIDRLNSAAKFMGINSEDAELKAENENIPVPDEEDRKITEDICSAVENLKEEQLKIEREKHSIEDTLNEVRAFSKLNVPFSELDQLSYLTLRIGRLDSKKQAELRESLGDKAVVIPLDKGKQILAASSRKGRFAMDTQLKKVSFEPVAIPQDFRGIPSEMITGLEEHLVNCEDELNSINNRKEIFRIKNARQIERLISSWNIIIVIEEIKSGFTETESLYNFSGWIPEDFASKITKGLIELTAGRIAIRSYSPEEISSIADGSEKVPVYVKHGAFVKGFETVVFSYGAPPYGTIDPTPFVAIFFTILFGIMFGDVGQGFILFLAGILIGKGPKKLAKFNHFSTPLVAVGISSMVMGLLNGAVFTSEHLLIAPTRMITAFFTGQPMDHILNILPLAESGGSLKKLLFFFGFTIGIGVLLNSTGLLINIVNRCILKKYEKAFFSKTGLAGLFFFWYAVFIALRIIFGGRFAWYDAAGLLLPVFFIFFGPVMWRIIIKEKPVLEHGLMVFIMEGFVEILETISSYVSNTVSFLRVGAFALSHAVLSFIIFSFTELLASSGISGSIFAFFLLVIGNTIIILLEGMIVAIQVMRLQYYEFFNKFFVETGVEFAPFRFKIKKT